MYSWHEILEDILAILFILYYSLTRLNNKQPTPGSQQIILSSISSTIQPTIGRFHFKSLALQ